MLVFTEHLKEAYYLKITLTRYRHRQRRRKREAAAPMVLTTIVKVSTINYHHMYHKPSHNLINTKFVNELAKETPINIGASSIVHGVLQQSRRQEVQRVFVLLRPQPDVATASKQARRRGKGARRRRTALSLRRRRAREHRGQQ
jgi:hypothetical protein